MFGKESISYVDVTFPIKPVFMECKFADPNEEKKAEYEKNLKLYMKKKNDKCWFLET